MHINLSTAAKVLGSSWRGEECVATGISTDSRSINQGDIFVALDGECFDGHDFILQAKKRGAIASIVSKNDCAKPVIQVPDTLKALALLAQYWHKVCDTKTIAVTGSVGKTTVKEMLAAMIRPYAQLCVTRGNFNNLIGLPLTLFNEKKEHQFTVIEMGANAKNEIAQLSQIANPKIGIITEIAAAHLEGFGSLEGVAKAKSELFEGLPENGVAIFNMDSPEQKILQQASSHCQQIKVSLHPQSDADIWAEDIQLMPDGWSFRFCSADASFEVKLNLLGKHNITNALLAMAGVKALGLDVSILSGSLEVLPAAPGRLEVHNLSDSVTLLDDSYNANPASMKAAIDLLSERSGKSILVMGDMGELGGNEIQLHKESGEYAYSKGITALYAIGELSTDAANAFGIEGKIFNNKQGLIEKLKKDVSNSSTEKLSVLVKGSRAAKMETVVQALLESLVENFVGTDSTKGNLLDSHKKNKNKQEQI